MTQEKEHFYVIHRMAHGTGAIVFISCTYNGTQCRSNINYMPYIEWATTHEQVQLYVIHIMGHGSEERTFLCHT